MKTPMKNQYAVEFANGEIGFAKYLVQARKYITKKTGVDSDDGILGFGKSQEIFRGDDGDIVATISYINDYRRRLTTAA